MANLGQLAEARLFFQKKVTKLRLKKTINLKISLSTPMYNELCIQNNLYYFNNFLNNGE